jgi:hypothetical protein
VPLSRLQRNIRVRFDVAYYQDTGTSEAFTETTTGTYEVQTYTDQVILYGKHSGDAAVELDAVDGQLTYDVNNIIAGPDLTFYAGTPSEEVWTSALGARNDSFFIPTANTPGAVPFDREYVSSWIQDHWDSPPATIQVDIGGSWVEYVFESIGPRPDHFDDYNNTITKPPLAPESSTITAYYEPGETMGVIYRQVDYSADE